MMQHSFTVSHTSWVLKVTCDLNVHTRKTLFFKEFTIKSSHLLISRVEMPAIMMADPGRQGPGPGDHQREAEHLRRMQVPSNVSWSVCCIWYFFHLYFEAPFQDAGEQCFLNLLNCGQFLLTNKFEWKQISKVFKSVSEAKISRLRRLVHAGNILSAIEKF